MNELLQLIGATALFGSLIILMAVVVVWILISTNNVPDESSAEIRYATTDRLDKVLERWRSIKKSKLNAERNKNAKI